MVSIMPFAYMVGVEDSDVMEKRVATFYAGKLTAKESRVAYFIASGIAALFGVIHCIAWSFDFPSQTEQFLWHVSSIAITCLPLGPPLVFGIEFVWENWVKSRVPNRLNQQMVWIFVFFPRVIIFCSSPMPYILARVTLLGLAFTSLRSLPAEVYRTVHWTTLIPHV